MRKIVEVVQDGIRGHLDAPCSTPRSVNDTVIVAVGFKFI